MKLSVSLSDADVAFLDDYARAHGIPSRSGVLHEALALLRERRLGDLARYLQAVELRIDKLRADPSRDAQWTADVKVVADEYAAELAALPPGGEPSSQLQEIRWMIEELRVALYAHPMRTRYPVSVKRIQKALDELPR